MNEQFDVDPDLNDPCVPDNTGAGCDFDGDGAGEIIGRKIETGGTADNWNLIDWDDVDPVFSPDGRSSAGRT